MLRGTSSGAGKSVNITEVARAIVMNTAYQASDPTKSALMILTFSAPAALTVSGGTSIQGEVRSGPLASVATGASGWVVAPYRRTLAGALVVGVNISTDDYETKTFFLPAGHYFAVRQTGGTGMAVVTATEQPMGVS